MRFVFPEINNVFEFKGNYINTLVIENRALLLRLMKDIHQSIGGNDGLSVLSKEYVPISMTKNAELISDFINFDINNKTLLSKIITVLEKVSLNETYYYSTNELLGEVEKSISLWAFDFSCDIITKKITPAALMKAAGIELRNSYEGVLGDAEKILDYMELVREFDHDKLFITLNMRSFFEDDVIESFLKTAISHEYKILMIENKAYNVLLQEKRFTIDEDLCEF